jgi:hypothetical protein
MLRHETEGMMSAAKTSNLNQLNVWASARIQIIDETNIERPVYRTIAETMYTPRHINDALKANGLKSAWVQWTCGRELWFSGKQIAEKA